MMDEALIDEVAQHGVIYNRQKYHLSGSGAKYETKDEAWQIIAMKLRTDVETCKKRWKYLRERYVSQRKQGDPPVYEHLSRPYLEKMKFLDSHIQPRKSYRNVPSFLTSPHSANSNYSEYNMDSKSNSSMKSGLNHYGNSSGPHHSFHQDQSHPMNAASALENNSLVKIEADQVFRDFAAAVASQQLQHMSHSQMNNHNSDAMDESVHNYQDHYRNSSMGDLNNSNMNSNNEQNGSNLIGGGGGAGPNGNGNLSNGLVPSSSSSMKSPLSSPLSGANGLHTPNGTELSSNNHHPSNNSNNHLPNYTNNHNDDMDSSVGSGMNMKKPRVQHNHNINNGPGSHYTDTDDDSDDNSSSILHLKTILNEQHDHPYNNDVPSTSNANSQRNNPTNHNNISTNSSNNNNNANTNAQQQNMFGSNADFLFQLYQQLPHQQQQTSSSATPNNFNKFTSQQNHHHSMPHRSSEHLLGELVTTELLKMTKDRRKHVQKRILEILFFDE